MNVKQSAMAFKKPNLVIIGNGMATGRLLDEILSRTPDKFNITVVGKEPFGSYNRIMLSSVLAGETTIDGIIQKPPQWYADNNITLIYDTVITEINSENKEITFQSNQNTLAESTPVKSTLPFDELVLATGSRSAKIPAKNQNIKGIFNFRDIKDTEQIQLFAKTESDNKHCTENKSGSNSNSKPEKTTKNALVVGGGLLGLEAAFGLALSGVNVTLVHRNKWLLNRQLDKVSGTMLQKVMEAKNIKFILNTEVTRFLSKQNSLGEAVLVQAELTNGAKLDVELCVIATGITPNKELSGSAGIDTERAIMVNDYMQSSHKNISALGECCQHKNATFGLVDPIWSQCKTLAERLCHGHLSAFANAPVPTKLKVSGVQLFSAGNVESTDSTQSYVLTDNKHAVYRKIIVKNDIIVGVLLFGDVSSGMAYFDMMLQQKKITHAMPELLIGHEFMPNEDKNNNSFVAA